MFLEYFQTLVTYLQYNVLKILKQPTKVAKKFVKMECLTV